MANAVYHATRRAASMVATSIFFIDSNALSDTTRKGIGQCAWGDLPG